MQAEQRIQTPGFRLRGTRERLKLTYREVEDASLRVAARRGDDQFQIGISRLADIEHRGTVPSIYRLYSLAVIYRLELKKVLRWYGIDLSWQALDTAAIKLSATNLLDPTGSDEIQIPVSMLNLSESDAAKTSYFSRLAQSWGKLPLNLLRNLEFGRYRYAFIGLEDRFMAPMIRPGSFVQIDSAKSKIATEGWTTEWDRPIYALETREGLECAWCCIREPELILLPHPASVEVPRRYRYPGEVDVVGQVVGFATRIHPERAPHARSGAVPR